jgi:ferritin-like metal-binding protein YciE
MKNKPKPSSGAKRKSAQSTSPDDLNTLFVVALKDIYWAEKHLVKSIPKLLNQVRNKQLIETIESHLQETKEHVIRLEKVFALCGLRVAAKKCEAMAGLVKEGKEAIELFESGPLLDAALIIGLQKIEHYEIATYGSMHVLADVLAMAECSDLLKQTLDEEHEADNKLNELAKRINKEAFNNSQKDVMVNVTAPLEASYVTV